MVMPTVPGGGVVGMNTSHVYVVTLAPTLPAASTGLMRNVCEPSLTLGIVTGVAHGAKAAPSRLQSAPVPSAP